MNQEELMLQVWCISHRPPMQRGIMEKGASIQSLKQPTIRALTEDGIRFQCRRCSQKSGPSRSAIAAIEQALTEMGQVRGKAHACPFALGYSNC